MRFSLRALLIVSALVTLAIFGARHCLGPVIPCSTASRIHPGMSHRDVLTILGSPNDGMTDETWAYVRAMNPGWFVVNFDSSRNVSSVDHETVF